MAARPYVGITGPVTVEETKAVCEEFSEAGYSMESPHVPMIGFLASYKTLNGQQMQNRRYPPADKIPELVQATEGKVLTMIHYNSREVATLSGQIASIFERIYDNGLCRALQLNIEWPDIAQVKKIKERHPKMQIVFQASHTAMEGKTHNEIVGEIRNYGDSVDYVLIDPSGGRGMPFDLESSVELYSRLKDQCPDLTVGFAGGFTGANVAATVRKIIGRIREDRFCIDAEGGLRDKITEKYGDDLLNIDKVREYLRASSLVLK